MTEQEFIEKWRGDITGHWASNANLLFWARSYEMPEYTLHQMCIDMYSMLGYIRIADCVLRIVRITLKLTILHESA